MEVGLKTGTVLYHSKMHPVLKRNFEVFSACDWLAALTAHIPNAGEHLVRDPCAVRRVSACGARTAQAGGESEAGRRPAPLGRVPAPATWVPRGGPSPCPAPCQGEGRPRERSSASDGEARSLRC